MITKIKESWNNIVNNMPNVIVTEDNLGDITRMFGLNDNSINLIKERMKTGTEFNAWNIVGFRLSEISSRNFKSDVHKQKALDKLCNGVYEYAMLAGI
jgi:hypothetical protein